MKVLHIAETAKGGVGTVINDLLNMDGVDSFALLPKQHVEKKFHEFGNKIHLFNRTGRNLFSFINLIIATRNLLKEINPDVIHLHSTFAGLLVRLYLLMKKDDGNIKIIYTPHAFSFIMDISIGKKYIFSLIERFFIKRTDKVICNSYYEFLTAVRYKLDSNKMTVIYNGVEVEGDVIKKSNEDTSTNVLFVGRFDYQKGYDYLKDVIDLTNSKANKNIKFDIVGDFVREEGEKSFSDNVTYHGWLAQDKVTELMRKSDVLLVTSRWESFGLVAIEAQSNGLAVIAFNCTALPEVVLNESPSNLFELNNTEAVANYLLENKKQFWLKDYRKRINFVSDNFSLKVMLEKYRAEYFEGKK